jgi:hypothetical protein
MHIALGVQRSDQFVHFRESCGDESSFFLTRIGPVGADPCRVAVDQSIAG